MIFEIYKHAHPLSCACSSLNDVGQINTFCLHLIQHITFSYMTIVVFIIFIFSLKNIELNCLQKISSNSVPLESWNKHVTLS